MLLGLAVVSWATARIGVHRLFPFACPCLGVFLFNLHHLPLDFICVSSLRPTYLHSFGRSFTYFQVSFQACDWLWHPMLWFQRRSKDAHGIEILNLDPNFCPGRSLNLGPWNSSWPRTLPLDHRTPPYWLS